MLNKDCSVDGLIAVIETSGSNRLREKSLKLLVKSKVRNDAIFKLLESLVVSDISPLVRSLAVKELFFKFRNSNNTNKIKTKSLLTWIIEHDRSTIVLHTVARIIAFSASNGITEILDLLKGKLSHLYNVCFEEALVLLRLDYLFKKKHPYVKEEPFRFDDYCKRFQSHVTDLRIEKFRTVPPIIKNFTRLTSLVIVNCKLRVIPKFLFKMESLESLYLRDTALSDSKELSESVAKFAKDKSSKKYEKMGVIPSDAFVLGLLEINYHPDKEFYDQRHFYKKFERFDNLITHDDSFRALYFRLNDKGEVETLGIHTSRFRFFPSQITNLKNLRILDLSFIRFKEIPESVSRLERLEYLNISYNGIREIPEAITKLNKLKYLNISRNQIAKVPEAITKLYNLKFLDISYNKVSNLGVILRMQTLVGLEIDYEGYPLSWAKRNDESDPLYYRYARNKFEEMKDQLSYSHQLLFYQFEKRKEKFKKNFDKVRDLLYKNTSCKHENKVICYYPYTLYCSDCKETLELWQYGIHCLIGYADAD